MSRIDRSALAAMLFAVIVTDAQYHLAINVGGWLMFAVAWYAFVVRAGK